MAPVVLLLLQTCEKSWELMCLNHWRERELLFKENNHIIYTTDTVQTIINSIQNQSSHTIKLIGPELILCVEVEGHV